MKNLANKEAESRYSAKSTPTNAPVNLAPLFKSLSAKKDIAFIRHAETVGYHKRDTWISHSGRSCAQSAASLLTTARFDCIVVSPLRRALQTAAVLFLDRLAFSDGCWPGELSADPPWSREEAATDVSPESAASATAPAALAPHLPTFVCPLARERIGTFGDVGLPLLEVLRDPGVAHARRGLAHLRDGWWSDVHGCSCHTSAAASRGAASSSSDASGSSSGSALAVSMGSSTGSHGAPPPKRARLEPSTDLEANDAAAAATTPSSASASAAAHSAPHLRDSVLDMLRAQSSSSHGAGGGQSSGSRSAGAAVGGDADAAVLVLDEDDDEVECVDRTASSREAGELEDHGVAPHRERDSSARDDCQCGRSGHTQADCDHGRIDAAVVSTSHGDTSALAGSAARATVSAVAAAHGGAGAGAGTAGRGTSRALAGSYTAATSLSSASSTSSSSSLPPSHGAAAALTSIPKEPRDLFRRRIAALQDYLRRLPFTRIAVVTHHHVIAEVTGVKADFCQVVRSRL